ncbi:MAG TPA: VWA domain-containing protein [Pyrinomonadaceae bacterium]|nr:VWA domain-containing protein [Pyrinomonadaceae bacterium]
MQTNQTIAVFNFQTKVVIAPSKTVTLDSAVDESRDTVQNRTISQNYKRGRYRESVNLTAIEYTDGSVWQIGLSQSPTAANRSTPPELSGGSKRPGSPQTPVTGEVNETDTLRINARMVNVPLIATRANGAFVTDLKQDELHVYEDGVEQTISSFSRIDQPFFVVLILDVSDSTAWTLGKIQREAIAFVDQLRPIDYVFVISFDKTIHALHEQATNDHQILRAAIMNARSGGSTSLHDAIQSVNRRILAPAPGRKALILFTDGGENSSLIANRKTIMRDAQELDATFYVVEYPPFGEKKYLETLTEQTGGHLYEGENEKKLREAFARIADELGHQYTLSFQPSSPSVPGESHVINVRTSNPGVNMRTRKAYTVREN